MAECCEVGNFCCGNRKIFYNYDKTNCVQPLVGYFKPTNSLARRNLVKGMELDNAALKKGLKPVEQIAAVVYFAHKNDLKVRAVGHGCSWSNNTDTRDILIDMLNLDQILKAKPQNKDSNIYHITVQGGMIMHDFVRAIDSKYGMGLPTIGNYDGQSVAGVVSTSTHGVGHDFQTLSNYVVELHMVIAKGIQIRIRPAKEGQKDEDFESVQRRIQTAKYGDPPVRICSTDVFRAAVVGLGSLGVIYAVTFECIPVFNVKQTRRYVELDWSSDKELLDTPPEIKKCGVGKAVYQSMLINPYPRQNLDNDVVSSIHFSGKQSEPTSSDCGCIRCTDRACNCCCFTVFSGQLLPTDCSISCIQLLTNCFPSLVPSFVEFGMKQFIRDTIDQKWYNTLVYIADDIHFKDAEYCIPLVYLDNALADIVNIVQDYYKLYRVYSLLVIIVRTVKADDLYMSPANRRRGDGKEYDQCCYIDVPFHRRAYGADEFQKKIEDHLITHYQGRPHWGKTHFLNASKVKQLYPDFHKWKRVYHLFNSDGTFNNEFTRAAGFEDSKPSKLEGSVDQLEVIHSSSVVTVSSSALHDHHQYQHHADKTHNRHGSDQEGRRPQRVISTQPKKSSRVVFRNDRDHFIPIPLHR